MLYNLLSIWCGVL